MKIKNLEIFKMPKAKSKICALSIAGVLTITGLAGCGSTATKLPENSISKLDNILLRVGNTTYSLGINGYSRVSQGCIKIELADGSQIVTDEKNIVLHNNDSKLLNQVEEIGKAENIETINNAENNVENMDTILLLSGEEIYSLQISGYTRLSSGFITIHLVDGSKMAVNEMNVVIYNSNSKMMDQIENIGKVKILKP